MSIKQFCTKNKVWDLKSYDLTRWAAFVGTIFFIGSMLMFVFQGPDTRVTDPNIFVMIWIKWFGYFTVQSNIVVGAYLLWYWLNPRHKAVNGNFLVYMVAYITITFTLYSALLLPAAIKSGDVQYWGWVGYTTNIIQHYLVPVSAFVFYGLYVWQHKNDFNSKWKLWSSMGMGLIYPCIYIAYACLLPFMSNHQYSVYGAFTNLDPKLEINGVAGNASALIYIFGALAGFVLVLILYRLAFVKFNKKAK